MKITFILPSYPRKPVGGYRVVYEYANHLAKRGHKISVVHPRSVRGLALVSNSPLLGRFLEYPVRFWRFFIKTKPDWQFIDPAVRMLYIPEPLARFIPDADAVFTTSWALADYVRQYPASKGEKFYLFQHYEIWDGPKDEVDATWQSDFHKIVISKWLYRIGLKLGAEDMEYIPNGIDHDHFKILNPIEGRQPYISMMYSNAAWKGSKDGIKALSLVREKYPDLDAVFFGVSKRNGCIPEWIKYVENPSQDVLVRDIYNRSSIFLCPSHSEGFALPPAEAMACGCAIATTDCGGVTDFAENEVTALVSPPKNPSALAGNIIRILSDDGLRTRLAEAGQIRIKRFTWEKSVNALENFLAKAVNQKQF